MANADARDFLAGDMVDGSAAKVRMAMEVAVMANAMERMDAIMTGSAVVVVVVGGGGGGGS